MELPYFFIVKQIMNYVSISADEGTFIVLQVVCLSSLGCCCV